MPTQKARINLAVPKDMEKIIKQIAKRDQVPVATKTLQLLKEALELEEDKILSAIGDARFTDDAKWISKEEVWKRYMN